MKESEETPKYEAQHHGKKFLKEAEKMAKEHMGGRHHEKEEMHEKKHEKKHGKHHEKGARKHHGK